MKHVTAYLAIDSTVYRVDMDSVGGNYDDSDPVWLANDVCDLSTDEYWALDLPPMGDTPGECLDAVIREARR